MLSLEDNLAFKSYTQAAAGRLLKVLLIAIIMNSCFRGGTRTPGGSAAKPVFHAYTATCVFLGFLKEWKVDSIGMMVSM